MVYQGGGFRSTDPVFILMSREWSYLTAVRKFFNIVSVPHPADVLPLVFSIAVIIQGIFLVVVSAQESHTDVSDRCSITAQTVWPGQCANRGEKGLILMVISLVDYSICDPALWT